MAANTNTSLGLEPGVLTTYWLSYDRDNMVIKYGKGYAMEQTTLLVCDFAAGAETGETIASKRAHWNIFFGLFDPARKDSSLLLYRDQRDIQPQPAPRRSLLAAGQTPGVVNLEPVVVVRPEPLTANPSPFVLDSSKASLSLLEAALYTFSSELPAGCRELYDTTVHCDLDSGGDRRLSSAIRSDFS